MIREAFGLQEQQIAGAPEWVKIDRFDIEARFDPAPVPGFDRTARLQAMLQNLLAERFQLRTHTEARDMPIYALMVEREDGRLGPQIKPAAVDCAALQAAIGRGGPPSQGAWRLHAAPDATTFAPALTVTFGAGGGVRRSAARNAGRWRCQNPV